MSSNEKIQKEWIEVDYSQSPYLLDQWKPYSIDSLNFQKKEFLQWLHIFQPGNPICLIGPPGSGKHCKLELLFQHLFPKKHTMYHRWHITEKKDGSHSAIWYQQTSWGAREYKWIESSCSEKDLMEYIHDWISDQSIQDDKKWIVLPNLDKLSQQTQRGLGVFIEKTQKYVQWIFLAHSLHTCIPSIRSRCIFFHHHEPTNDELNLFLESNPHWKQRTTSNLYSWLEMTSLSIPKIGKVSYLLECHSKQSSEKYPYEFLLLLEAKKYWFQSISIPCKEDLFHIIRGVCHGLFHLEISIHQWYQWLIQEGQKTFPQEFKSKWTEYMISEYNQCKHVFRELFVFEMSWVQSQHFLHQFIQS
jgi:hypothetical protein